MRYPVVLPDVTPSETSNDSVVSIPTQNDNVDHPSHYTNGSIECIDAIESAMTKEQFVGYLRGNILKYVWRFGLKNTGFDETEDLKKARWYLDKLISVESES